MTCIARRISILTVSSLLLAACNGNSDAARMGQLVWQAMPWRSGTKVTLAQAAAIPYASMGVSLGNGDQGLLVLGAASPTLSEWYAGEEVMIGTRGGRVVKTIGLPSNLGEMRLDTAPNGSDGHFTMIIDLPDRGVFGAVGNCSIVNMGQESITILGTAIDTRRMAEHCDVPALNWEFDSEFWKDLATDFIWRSRQNIHPDLPALTLEVFRPQENGR